MKAKSSRRDFLKLTATVSGGLLLGFGIPARGQVRDRLTTDPPFAPNAFLRIDRAGKVTFVMPVIEMGQGTYTSLPMLIAEELEVDVDKVAIEHSPPDDKLYANPLVGVQLTGASTAIRGTYVPLRQAGASARLMLVTAAAHAGKSMRPPALPRTVPWCTPPLVARSATARWSMRQRSCPFLMRSF